MRLPKPVRPDCHTFYAKARLDHNWKAAYGLELIRITREADLMQEISGEYVEPYYPTEEEFRAARLAFKNGVRRSPNVAKLLTIRGVFRYD